MLRKTKLKKILESGKVEGSPRKQASTASNNHNRGKREEIIQDKRWRGWWRVEDTKEETVEDYSVE